MIDTDDPPVGITIVSFDADGTLWDFEATMRRALVATIRFLVERDRRLDRVTVAELIEARQRVGARHTKGHASMEHLRLLGFREALSERGVADETLVQDAASFYLAARFEDPILYPDVRATLEALAKSYALALVTNGNSDPERCGLPGVFSHVVFAHRVGAAKPDRRIYDELIRRSGRDSHQILHVGDSLANDVEGARRVGMRAVWLSRSGAGPGAHGVVPDATIRTLDELPDLLDRWSAA